MLLFMNRFSPPSSFLYSFLALSFPPFHLVQNSDIYVPIGTDADYVDTLIEYMVPVATVAVVLCLLFAISVGILLYFRSPFVYFLRKCDIFGGKHMIRDGGAMRITKTALGGFITFLFLSSLSIFGVYAVTSYVQLPLLSRFY